MNRGDLARYWDAAVVEFLDGGDPTVTRPELGRWAAGYTGSGRGVIDLQALPEPYIGRLQHPAMVLLGLNPGGSDLRFHSRTGLFAAEIRDAGGYVGWAANDPYSRNPWRAAHGRNQYLMNRAAFAVRWCADPRVTTADLLLMELYPWHSTAVVGSMRPDPGIIREFVWDPVSEIEVEFVFAFGRPWVDVALALELPERRFEAAFTVSSRRARTFQLPTGQTLVTMWHAGSAGPPAAADTEILRVALRSA